MNKEQILAIAIFFGLQLINVILSTIRSIMTVKAGKHTAAIINAVSYTFYNGIVKLLTGQEMWVVLTTTFITNIIGVYVANFILDKFRKDKLWKIEATIPSGHTVEVDHSLSVGNIPHSYIKLSEKHTVFYCYCATQSDSAFVKKLLDIYNAKYFVSESKILI